MMMWMLVVTVVLVLGAVAAVAAGRAGTWEEPERDRVGSVLAAGPLGAEDLRRVRFPLALRGYRMKDVDALLDRLADQVGRQLAEQPADGTAEQGGEGATTGLAAQRADGDTT